MTKNISQKLCASFAVMCLAVSGALVFGWSPARAGNGAGSGASAAADVPPLDSRAAVKKIDTVDDVPYRGRLALMRAQEESDRGDLKAAIEELRDFLTDHPENNHFILRNHLGNLLVQAGKPEEALAEYQAAVSLEKLFTQGWLNIGEIAYNLGRYDVAAGALRNGYEQSERKQSTLLYYCSAAYLMAKDPASAVPLLEELVGGDFGRPKLEWFKALIAACAEIKDTERGRKAADLLVRVYPDDAGAWYLAFQFYAGIGDYEQAAVALKVADYIEPLARQQAKQLGDVFATIKVPSLASSHYQRVVGDSSGTARDYEKLASACLASYDTDAASRAIEDGLKIGPTYRLWSLLGDTRFIQLDYAGAFDAYRECAKLDSTQGRPLLMMGYCAIQVGRTDEAVPYLERALEFPDQKMTAEQLLAKARPAAAAAEGPEADGSDELIEEARREEGH
jgi:tetratricopeptide (TPR) repeat protein